MKPTIICVEDEDVLREDLAGELRLGGYTVVEAANGEEALARLREITPDILLCDITMPIMDGVDLLKEIRQNANLATTPFVFMTARDDIRLPAGLLPAPLLLRKPLDFDEVLSFVANALKSREVCLVR